MTNTPHAEALAAMMIGIDALERDGKRVLAVYFRAMTLRAYDTDELAWQEALRKAAKQTPTGVSAPTKEIR